MNDEVKFQLEIAEEQMQETILHLEKILSKIRAGKANPQMLHSVKVDYYGVLTPLSQASNIITPDSQTISIQPFDKSLIEVIEQSIIAANLGLTPSNNGEKVILNIPPLTEERRVELAKQVKGEIEKSKISIRNIRQKSNDEMKKLSDNGLSEDLVRDAQQSVQVLTDEYVKKIDAIYSEKESEIMTV